MTARRMTSGLVLKYRNGECFVIRHGYKLALPASIRLPKRTKVLQKGGVYIGLHITVPAGALLNHCPPHRYSLRAKNPPSPNDRLSKAAKIADIKALVEASGKTPTCIVLKQRSNSGYYGKLCYLEKQMAEEQGFEPWEDFHPRRFSRPVHSTTLPLLRQEPNNRLK